MCRHRTIPHRRGTRTSTVRANPANAYFSNGKTKDPNNGVQSSGNNFAVRNVLLKAPPSENKLKIIFDDEYTTGNDVNVRDEETLQTLENEVAPRRVQFGQPHLIVVKLWKNDTSKTITCVALSHPRIWATANDATKTGEPRLPQCSGFFLTSSLFEKLKPDRRRV